MLPRDLITQEAILCVKVGDARMKFMLFTVFVYIEDIKRGHPVKTRWYVITRKTSLMSPEAKYMNDY